MRTVVRVSWLIAACLIVARIGKAVCDFVLWHLGFSILALPGRYEFVRWLNAWTLLAVSIALGCTLVWLIEERLARGTAPASPKTSEHWWSLRPWWNALREQWAKEGRKSPSTKYWMVGFVILCAIYGVLKGCAGLP